MNSLLQQLYMIPTFRTGILACKDPARDLNSQEDLLFQLQRMFLHLQLSDCRSYNPKDFCLAFKDDEEKSVNVSEQMDIDEFSGMLFDRL